MRTPFPSRPTWRPSAVPTSPHSPRFHSHSDGRLSFARCTLGSDQRRRCNLFFDLGPQPQPARWVQTIFAVTWTGRLSGWASHTSPREPAYQQLVPARTGRRGGAVRPSGGARRDIAALLGQATD